MIPADRTAIVAGLRHAIAHIQLRTILTHMEVSPARIEAMMSELFAERPDDAPAHRAEGDR